MQISGGHLWAVQREHTNRNEPLAARKQAYRGGAKTGVQQRTCKCKQNSCKGELKLTVNASGLILTNFRQLRSSGADVKYVCL